jgi:hypothetical protein
MLSGAPTFELASHSIDAGRAPDGFFITNLHIARGPCPACKAVADFLNPAAAFCCLSR